MANTLLPPPYKGQNDQFPLISIQSPYCERMENFNNLDGVVKVRQGNDLFATNATYGNVRDLTSYPNPSSPRLIAMVNENADFKWYFVTAGSFSLQHTVAGTWSAIPVTFYFNNYLFYCIANSGTMIYYNGSAWGNAGYTFGGITFYPYGGTEFKSRAYMIGGGSAMFGYSGIDAITGAVTLVDLSSQVTNKSLLYMIRPLSMTQNITSESVLSFIFNTGEILVYSGSYPDSPNWGRIARFKISKPIYYNAFVEAKGDSILLTESEILSLRNLFIGGYDKERDEGIGSTINERWRQIIKAYSATQLTYITGIYDEKRDRIVIAFPLYVDPSTAATVANTSFQLIYDFNLEAWYEYYATDASAVLSECATYHEGDSYLGIAGSAAGYVVKLEGTTNFLDDQLDGSGTNPIEYSLITAPLPISKFGANAISGVEAIVKSDLYPQTNYKFIADLGRQETAAQNLPDQGTSISKPMMNVGIQGAIAAQLEIYGSTVSASIGLEISALNVWYNSGDSGSR